MNRQEQGEFTVMSQRTNLLLIIMIELPNFIETNVTNTNGSHESFEEIKLMTKNKFTKILKEKMMKNALIYLTGKQKK